MKSPICIIGCGWLGLPLAMHFISKGWQVHGSTSTEHKLNALSSEGIIPFLLKFSSEGVSGNLKGCLNTCKTLILNIPPGLRKNTEQDYVGMMLKIMPHLENSSVENILFIGSTSVYDDNPNMPEITEKSKTSNSETAKKLLRVEEFFKQNTNFKTTILRFGGLIGKDRHPAKYLAGKINLKNPKAPVNLIHLTDCITIINAIIEQEVWAETFNAANPSHPSRETYYTETCMEMKLPVPHFNHDLESLGKQISSQKLAQQLNYRFKAAL